VNRPRIVRNERNPRNDKWSNGGSNPGPPHCERQCFQPFSRRISRLVRRNCTAETSRREPWRPRAGAVTPPRAHGSYSAQERYSCSVSPLRLAGP
jgi:hypothetical protein